MQDSRVMITLLFRPTKYTHKYRVATSERHLHIVSSPLHLPHPFAHPLSLSQRDLRREAGDV